MKKFLAILLVGLILYLIFYTPTGQSIVGDFYRGSDNAEAVHWYRKAAEQGNANAQTNLGVMYESGKGVDKDETEAVVWFRKAAEQGYAWGQNNLGVMYANGKGIKKDNTQAMYWYRKAAERGNANAQTNLGNQYRLGKGVDKDEAEAVKWYRKAAERGYANAQTNLGWMYESGKGVKKDEAEAVNWYRKAAEQGYARAYGMLGWLLITQGKFDKAKDPTEKAHKMDPQEFYWAIDLGHIYLLKGDHKTARSYYQKALPLISDKDIFEKGVIADFELFIKKGWQVEACKKELEWIMSAKQF